MNDRVMSPAPQQPQSGPYEYVAWPAWRYSVEPPHKGEVFQQAEDVPEGWVTMDELKTFQEAGAFEPAPAPAGDSIVSADISLLTNVDVPVVEPVRQLTADQRKDAIDKLIDGNSQKDLIAMLEAMQAVDDSIEFGGNWGKPKLAEAIVDNGGPLEA